MPDFIKGLLKEKIKINCHYVYEDWVDYGTKDNLKIARKSIKINSYHANTNFY